MPNHGPMRMSRKLSMRGLNGCFKMNQMQEKLFALEALQNKWLRLLRKTGYVATVPLEEHRTVNSEWNTIICMP